MMKIPNRFLMIGATASLMLSCSPDSSTPETGEASSPFSKVPAQLEASASGEIAKLHTKGGIFLASQPTPADFELAKAGGVKTVINLRHDEEIAGFKEKDVVEKLRMTYINLPWDGVDELTDDVFDRCRDALKTAKKPVLLHCKSSNRVGAVWLPYRVIDEGLSVEDALAEAKTAGLKSADYEAKALDYIKRKSS